MRDLLGRYLISVDPKATGSPVEGHVKGTSVKGEVGGGHIQVSPEDKMGKEDEALESGSDDAEKEEKSSPSSAEEGSSYC